MNKEFHEKIDKNERNLLPIKNGKIIDLKTLIIRDRTRNDLFSFECPVSFLGTNTNFDNIERFMNDITCKKSSLKQYLRKLGGYFLTGETNGRGFYVFVGKGRNGKSIFISMISKILSNYVKPIEKSLIMKSRDDQARPRPELIAISKKRLATCLECKEGSEFNDDFLKNVTGGDTISARKLYSNDFEDIAFHAKILIATNNKPKFNINDIGMVDRVKYIPFNARFIKINSDEDLINQDDSDHDTILKKNDDDFIAHLLNNCMDEIFTYFVIGAQIYYNEGLDDIDEIKNENSKTINAFSKLDSFIEEKCTLDPNEKITCSSFHSSYKLYCNKKNDIQPAEIKNVLALKGIVQYRSNGLHYRGINLKSNISLVD